jgi:hypothetical protein
MKIKLLSFKLLPLIIILTGVLATSGCVDSQAQPIIHRYQEDLYRSIFYPYAGLLKGEEMPGINPQGPHSGMPEDHDSSRSLQDAALMLDENIRKAEAISERLEPGVQYLKDQGKDVSRLESLIEEYNGLVEDARNYLELAESSSGEEESTEKDNLIQSQKSMVQASLVLKDIFDELKLLMPGSEELNETALLNATGEGKVALMGSFDLRLHLENGEIAVMSPDSIIKIEGDYVLEIKEGHPDNIFLYHIQSADLEVSGPRKTLLLNGENITVEAEGEGYASFFGNGTYSVENDGMKKEEQWAADSLFDQQGMIPEPEKTGNNIHPVGMHGLETGIKGISLKKITIIEMD